MRKALVAHFTAVGFLPGVDPLVCSESLLARERLATDGARVRSLFSVQLHVPPEVGRLQEAAVAEFARVRSVAGIVYAPVLAKGAAVNKCLATGVAEKGPLAGVYPLVVLEAQPISERFAARRATVRPFPRVGSGVRLESTGCGEGQRTLGTQIRPLPRVLAHVHPQFCTRFAHLLTVRTHVPLTHGVPSLVGLKDVRQSVPLVTEATGVRGLVRFPHMDEDSGPTGKSLLTLLALERFRPSARVFLAVNLQLLSVRKSLTTVYALVRLQTSRPQLLSAGAAVSRARFLPCVCSLVRVKVSRLRERLSASATSIRSLPGMASQVKSQKALKREDFPTVTALVLIG